MFTTERSSALRRGASPSHARALGSLLPNGPERAHLARIP
jgi:hypothetical protein